MNYNLKTIKMEQNPLMEGLFFLEEGGEVITYCSDGSMIARFSAKSLFKDNGLPEEDVPLLAGMHLSLNSVAEISKAGVFIKLSADGDSVLVHHPKRGGSLSLELFGGKEDIGMRIASVFHDLMKDPSMGPTGLQLSGLSLNTAVSVFKGVDRPLILTFYNATTLFLATPTGLEKREGVAIVGCVIEDYEDLT
jgi:hypothetical protein